MLKALNIPIYVVSTVVWWMSISLGVAQSGPLLSQLFTEPIGVQWVTMDSLIENTLKSDSLLVADFIAEYARTAHEEDAINATKLAHVLQYRISIRSDTIIPDEAHAFESWLVQEHGPESEILRALGFQILAEQFWNANDLAPGLEFYIRAFALYRHFPPEVFPYKSKFWYDYANKYYYFRDFLSVKDLFLQMLHDIPKPYQAYQISSLNTLAISYRQLGMLDSSDYYFRRAMDQAYLEGSDVWVGIIRGNQAQNMILQGRQEEAIPLLESNIASSRNKNALVDLAYSLAGMAEIRLSQARHKEALELLREAISILEGKGKLGNDEIRARLFIPMGKALMANGRAAEGFAMLDAGRIAQDSIEARRNALLITGVQLKLEAESHLAALNMKETQIRMQQLWNGVLIFVLAGISVFTFVFFRQKNKIAREKRRSDELLLNILPAEVAADLKQKGRVDARHFKEVTILFTDFRDFTQWVERHSPDDLVADLDFCFRAFDEIIIRHGLEKIKTIGDAYMAVAGLPQETTDHPVKAVQAALEIRNCIDAERQRRESEGGSFFEIRIGLHTGSVVAGVIGLRKFSYDIWGDTVNIAARMESSGETGKVNVSESTFKRIQNHFACRFRGRIPAKHKGDIGMYFVESNSKISNQS